VALQEIDEQSATKPFSLPLSIHLDHALGFAVAPALSVTAFAEGRSVPATRLPVRQELAHAHQIAIPAAGRWLVELRADSTHVGSLFVDLARESCVGAEATWSLVQTADGPTYDLHAGRTGPTERFGLSLHFDLSLAIDASAAVSVEWRHRGKAVHRETLVSQHVAEASTELDKLAHGDFSLCSRASMTHTFVLPKKVPIRKGPWELWVVGHGAPSVALAFEIAGKEEDRSSSEEEGYIYISTTKRTLAAPSADQSRVAALVRAKTSAQSWPRRVQEVRAVIRSAEVLEARVAYNRARKLGAENEKTRGATLATLVKKHGGPFRPQESEWPSGKTPKAAPPVRPVTPKSGCNELYCASYPAISSDRKHLVYRDYECLGDDEEGLPAIGEVTRHYQIVADKTEPVRSRNMKAYTPLVCAGAMHGGATVTVSDSGDPAVIRDAKGNVLATVEQDGYTLRTVCSHLDETLAIVVRSDQPTEGFGDAPGDDCGTPGGATLHLLDY